MQLNFEDFDSYNAATEGWGLEFIQLDRGPLGATLSMVRSTHVLVINTSLSRSFYQQGEAPSMGQTFGLYAHPKATAGIRWLDRHFAENTLAVFPADGAYDSYSSPGMDILAITIDRQFLEDLSEPTGLQRSINLLPSRGGIFSCRPFEISELRHATFTFLQTPQTQSIAIHAQEIELGLCMLKALAAQTSEQKRPSIRNRDRAFTAAIEQIHESSWDKLTIPELCKNSGASERALRYAFSEKLGISPKTYLTAVRLNRARSKLLQTNREKYSILDIASDQGFWHMGQFAADYKKFFGERPIDTLNSR